MIKPLCVSVLVARAERKIYGKGEIVVKTGVIYARYSCDKQTKQSIEEQLHICNDYAARNDIVIVENYISKVYSKGLSVQMDTKI